MTTSAPAAAQVPIAAGRALPRVAIVGAGAIGGYLGIPLAARGLARLAVLARGDTLAAIRTRGWRLQRPDGEVEIADGLVASDDPADLGPQDVVVVATKAHSIAAVAPQVAALCGADTLVIPVINGVPWWLTLSGGLPVNDRLESVDPGGVIARHIDIRRVVGGVVFSACSVPSPGISRHHSGSRQVYGEPAAGAGSSARVDAWVGLLNAAGHQAEVSTDIRSALWTKLLGNACFNPVSLLTGAYTDDLIDDPAVRALFAALMTETKAVAAALGIRVDVEVDDRIALTRKLGHVRTSMLQDSAAGKPVELDAILGAVVELADRLRLPVPNSRAVLALARRKAICAGLHPG